MRKIEFRGKCKISGDIVFGDLIHGVRFKKGKIYILPRDENLAYVKHCDPLDGVEVIPETVGQFTGLKDKNGVDIYEGDIVKGVGVTSNGNPVVRTVVFDDESARFGLTNVNNQITFEPLKWISFPLEINGNVHDTPSESPNGSKINK